MKELRSSLLVLQTLDAEIERAIAILADFEPRLLALDEPLRALEQELETATTRLAEMRTSARRLEQAAEQKRDRLRTYEARMERVRNMREESAARAEMDLIRRATEADETEALEMMEQATRTDLKLDDLTRQIALKQADIAPRREALLAEREQARETLDTLKDRRNNQALRLEPQALRLYERVRSGRTRTAVAPLTSEGACGNCYNILPIQQQAEIRREDRLVRCEQCGVILYPAESANA